LSIKPTYSQRIFSGEKKFEFRKTKPRSAIDFVVVYESSPTRNIVGGFTIKTVFSGTPDEIWEKCKFYSGIDKGGYREYCGKASLIHAFEIDQIYKLEKPMSPFKLFLNFKAPQSFCYLHSSMMPAITEASEHIQNRKIGAECSIHEQFLEQLQHGHQAFER